MEIKGKHAYAASVDAVFKSFGDKTMIEQKFAALGARNLKFIQCELTKAALDIKMQREVPADVPGMLKKFLGEWNEVTQEEHWTGTPGKQYRGEVKIAIKGVPVTISGVLVLSGDTKACTNDITLKIDCGIPLIGKKLAEFVAENSRTAMQSEYDYLKVHL